MKPKNFTVLHGYLSSVRGYLNIDDQDRVQSIIDQEEFEQEYQFETNIERGRFMLHRFLKYTYPAFLRERCYHDLADQLSKITNDNKGNKTAKSLLDKNEKYLREESRDLYLCAINCVDQYRSNSIGTIAHYHGQYYCADAKVYKESLNKDDISKLILENISEALKINDVDSFAYWGTSR